MGEIVVVFFFFPKTKQDRRNSGAFQICQRCSVGSYGGLKAVQIQRAVSQGVPGVGKLPFGNWCFGDHIFLLSLAHHPHIANS